jgi:heat shock protein 90kDa beta
LESDPNKAVGEEIAKSQKPKRTETVLDWELLNGQKAIWLRNPKDIEPEEYNSFYAALSKVRHVIRIFSVLYQRF